MKKIKTEKERLNLFETAMAQNGELGKSIKSIRECLIIYDKIDSAKVNNTEYLFLENSEFEILKSSVNKVQWIPDKQILKKVDDVYQSLEQAEDC